MTVEDGGKVTVLPHPVGSNAGFAWGSGGKQASNLSLALAESVLGDHQEAIRFHQRLKHRTVMAWTAESQWTITEKDILSHIEDMRQNERESAQAKAMVAQQPTPVAYEGGTGIGGIPFKRSDKDQGPGPMVAVAPTVTVQAPIGGSVATAAVWPNTSQRSSIVHIEAIPDDWPEKIDGFRAMAGDFVTGTRLIYCLVLCGCYSWQDAAQVSEEKLRAIPLWGDALMAEMMEALSKRNIIYIIKEKRQQLMASALAKLTAEEKEAMGLS